MRELAELRRQVLLREPFQRPAHHVPHEDTGGHLDARGQVPGGGPREHLDLDATLHFASWTAQDQVDSAEHELHLLLREMPDSRAEKGAVDTHYLRYVCDRILWKPGGTCSQKDISGRSAQA